MKNFPSDHSILQKQEVDNEVATKREGLNNQPWSNQPLQQLASDKEVDIYSPHKTTIIIKDLHDKQGAESSAKLSENTGFPPLPDGSNVNEYPSNDQIRKLQFVQLPKATNKAHARSLKTNRSNTSRQLKVANLIKQILADVFSRKKGLDINLINNNITITRVEVTSDLRIAFCYFLPFGDFSLSDSITKSLEISKNIIRHQVTELAGLRFSPELKFRFDDGAKNAITVESTLQKLNDTKTNIKSGGE
ncbi:MAG: ribosome-binding factor A [Rickettsiaceae bacterium]|nr:ribosome-binding factor A [Rickettsiaceae bacterium]